MRISDWSSDVCSSDLDLEEVGRCLVGRDVEAGPGDHGLIRVIAGVVVHPGRLAKASLDLSLLRAELPGQAGRHVGVEIDGNRLVGGSRLGGRSEEHTSELQSLMRISYAVFCLKKKKYTNK